MKIEGIGRIHYIDAAKACGYLLHADGACLGVSDHPLRGKGVFGGPEYSVANVFNGIPRMAIPLFVMSSGRCS